MLAVTSNWAIHDGSLAVSRPAAASGWLEAVARALVRGGWCRDGRYRPLEEATLVFAGDTFDWLLSDAWAGRDRPWHGGSGGERARGRVARASIRAARPAVRTLVCWARQGLPVPAATPQGRPSTWATQPARLRVVVLAGDRDPWLADAAPVAHRLGLVVGEEWSDGVRHLRHGHDLDPIAHRGGLTAGRAGRQPTLAESLMTDLVVRFAVAARGLTTLWPHVRSRLCSLSAARPSQWPQIVAGLMAEAGDGPRIGSLWQRAVAAWHLAAVRDLPACDAEFDALSGLAAWLDRIATDAKVPETVRRLDRRAASCFAAGVIVAGTASAAAPTLVCHGQERAAREEPLGGVPAGSSIVAVGVRPAGRGIIDAA